MLRSLATVRRRSGQDMFGEVSCESKQLGMNEKLEDVTEHKDPTHIFKSLCYP